MGRSIGARRPEELEALTVALVAGSPLPELVGVGATSSLSEAANSGTQADGAADGAALSPDAATTAEALGTEAQQSSSPLSPPNTPPGRRSSIGPRSHG